MIARFEQKSPGNAATILENFQTPGRDRSGAGAEWLVRQTPHSTRFDPDELITRRFQQNDRSDRLPLLAPVIVLVLGATAIPVELQSLDLANLSGL